MHHERMLDMFFFFNRAGSLGASKKENIKHSKVDATCSVAKNVGRGQGKLHDGPSRRCPTVTVTVTIWLI